MIREAHLAVEVFAAARALGSLTLGILLRGLEPAAEAEAPAAEEAPNPERRCFTVRTAKGNVTRCNDKADE